MAAVNPYTSKLVVIGNKCHSHPHKYIPDLFVSVTLHVYVFKNIHLGVLPYFLLLNCDPSYIFSADNPGVSGGPTHDSTRSGWHENWN